MRSIIFLFFLSLPVFNANAVQAGTYIRTDTVKVSGSLTYIFKIDTTEYYSDDYTRNLITRIEILDPGNNRLIQTVIDTSELNFAADGVTYVDINMDGFTDIDINLGYYNLIPTHSFWLFDKTSGRYYHSPDYSGLNDYGIDKEKKQIESSVQYVGGRGGETDTYKIVNGNLFLIKSEYSDRYEYEKKEIVNGKLITVSKVESNEGVDENGNSTLILVSYKYYMDSLLVAEKSWLTGVQKVKGQMWNSDIYNCGPWGGCMKYLRKEVFTYKKIGGRLIASMKKYQVINDKWERVNKFTK